MKEKEKRKKKNHTDRHAKIQRLSDQPKHTHNHVGFMMEIKIFILPVVIHKAQDLLAPEKWKHASSGLVQTSHNMYNCKIFYIH